MDAKKVEIRSLQVVGKFKYPGEPANVDLNSPVTKGIIARSFMMGFDRSWIACVLSVAEDDLNAHFEDNSDLLEYEGRIRAFAPEIYEAIINSALGIEIDKKGKKVRIPRNATNLRFMAERLLGLDKGKDKSKAGDEEDFFRDEKTNKLLELASKEVLMLKKGDDTFSAEEEEEKDDVGF